MCDRIIAQVRHHMGHEVMNWFGYDASHVVTDSNANRGGRD